ncbi:MAG: hypothetical protein PVI40_03710 [Chlamydiota bacterium]
MSSTSPTNLSLPKSLWTNIASFLSPKEQARNNLVSQAFHSVSQVRECRFSFIESLSEKEINLIREHSPGSIIDLIRQRFNELLDPNFQATKEFLSKVIQSNLQRSSRCGFSDAIRDLHNLSREKRSMIEDLKLSGNASLLEGNDLVEIMEQCPNLKSLDLSEMTLVWGSITKIPPNRLERLILTHLTYSRNDTLENFVLKSPCLKEVDLSSTQTTGRCLEPILEKDQLKKLNLSYNPDLDLDFLIRFFQEAAHIEEVDLSGTNITGEELKEIPLENQLRTLTLCGNQNLDKEFLTAFFLKATHLQEAYLVGTNLEERDIMELSQKTNCKIITSWF